MHPHNFGANGNILMKLFQAISRDAGIIMCVQLLEVPPPKIWEGQLAPTFGAISDNFRLWSRISPKRVNISKNWKVVDQLQPLQHWGKKFGELWSAIKKVLEVHTDPPKWTYRDNISALKGCCALKFLHALEINQALISHTRSGTGVPPKKF